MTTAKNQYIEALNELGQSIWYDNLSLDVLQSGELAQLVEQGVSGLTSNPTIFKKAIADTEHYDKRIRELNSQGERTAEEICEALMVDDVGAAADLLRDCFDRTRGLDGYASIEVSPRLAHDTAETIKAAQRLWDSLSRPNIMIKIPATAEGIPAIEEVLSRGINVNITLIFSTDVYAEVVTAYLNALKRIADSNTRKRLASVASFFVSRVDAIVEENLPDSDRARALIGKVGIANSKKAYAHFEKVFHGAPFAKFQDEGVAVQRPLWASTGTKNPHFHPLLYVQELAGRDTVNTLPPSTLQQLLEDATIMPNLHEGLDSAEGVLQEAEAIGIDFEGLLQKLQSDGVESFAQSYEELLSAVEKKRSALAA